MDNVSDSIIIKMIKVFKVMHNGDLNSLEDFREYVGICSLTEDCTGTDIYYSTIRKEMIKAFRSWSEFSGDEIFPIGDGSLNAGLLFTSTSNMWEITPYGCARRRLAGHLAQHFKYLFEYRNASMSGKFILYFKRLLGRDI